MCSGVEGVGWGGDVRKNASEQGVVGIKRSDRTDERTGSGRTEDPRIEVKIGARRLEKREKESKG
jgi:hypothetical protein